MAAAIYIFDDSISANNDVSTNFIASEYVESLPSESGVFKRANGKIDFNDMPNDNRKSLEVYYQNRAYPGAPPVIPHPLLSEKGIGDNTCLQCHQNGGFVEVFKAYAPISPHPDLINCRQCHVPQKTDKLFKSSNWEKADHPQIAGSVLPGSPPPIPHGLQMRENCLTCHAGPSAPKEILVSHPERVNCRQCHATKTNTIKIDWDSIPSKKPKIQWEDLSQ